MRQWSSTKAKKVPATLEKIGWRNGVYILGLTAIGRTTLFLLKFNEPSRLQLRQALAAQGLYPDMPPLPPPAEEG
jgi:hypothetical protein